MQRLITVSLKDEGSSSLLKLGTIVEVGHDEGDPLTAWSLQTSAG